MNADTQIGQLNFGRVENLSVSVCVDMRLDSFCLYSCPFAFFAVDNLVFCWQIG
jgi:hypothetical protein